MKKPFQLAAFFCAVFMGAAHAQEKPTLWLIGDSTVNNGTKGQKGWGSVIAPFFDETKINVVNKARGGRSSRTFYTEGLWDAVLKEMKAGDFVLMQFGHNDGGSLRQSTRASLKGNGEETQEYKDEKTGKTETVHTFGWYLRKYIADTKAKGATPIVLSLIPRNDWKDGKVLRAFPGYGQMAKEAAQSGGAAFIDLNGIVGDKYDALGEAAVKPFFPHEHTHTDQAGAELNAQAVVEGLKALKDAPFAAFLSEKGRALSASQKTMGLFDKQNLIAWCAVPFDAKKRGPEERAEMLQRLGFSKFAYDWRAEHIPTFDAEVEALKQRGIDFTAWWFPTDARDPNAQKILDVIQRHKIHPQLWVMGSGAPIKTPEEQEQRIEQEAERIRQIVELAKPSGCSVQLYNHNGWFGQPDNEVAVIERLKQKGINGVGMVYNFSHGHGDIADFPALWKRIQPYVVAVNVTGMVKGGDDKLIPPSQGDHELEMLRIIQESGWHGPIGLIAEQGGDAEVTLGNYQRGLAWLAAELNKPGSGGAKPTIK